MGIRADSMRKLRKELVASGHIDKFGLDGLSRQRRPVFAGGFAILSAIFKALDIDHLRVSSGALREGLLYDLLGRIHHEDVREGTINDLVNATRSTGHRFNGLALPPNFFIARPPRHGRWTLRVMRDCWSGPHGLHPIGMEISHSQYHKHGAYLLRFLDMPGFARGEQMVLAMLVRGHRRKFPAEEFKQLSKQECAAAQYLCVLLRLSVLLHRSHGPQPLPSLASRCRQSRCHYAFQIAG